MDYSYGGVPFVSVAAKAGIDLDTLDYSYGGVPFWWLEVSGGTPSTGSVKISPAQAMVSAGNGSVSIRPIIGRLE